MDRALFILSHERARRNAVAAVQRAPDGYAVRIDPPKRTDAQNRRLWAMLNEIAAQVEWYGRKLSAEDWKHVFSAALTKQDVVPGLDGGFVVLGKSTSRMTVREMTDLIELMHAFCAERGVRLHDLQEA